jgi:hypothetical protein
MQERGEEEGVKPSAAGCGAGARGDVRGSARGGVRDAAQLQKVSESNDPYCKCELTLRLVGCAVVF